MPLMAAFYLCFADITMMSHILMSLMPHYGLLPLQQYVFADFRCQITPRFFFTPRHSSRDIFAMPCCCHAITPLMRCRLHYADIVLLRHTCDAFAIDVSYARYLPLQAIRYAAAIDDTPLPPYATPGYRTCFRYAIYAISAMLRCYAQDAIRHTMLPMLLPPRCRERYAAPP